MGDVKPTGLEGVLEESGFAKRVREALEKGQRDDSLLSGRDYNERYWRSAKAALGNLERQLDVVTRERDALRAVLDD